MTAKASEVRISLSPEATPEQMRAYIKKLEAQAQATAKAAPFGARSNVGITRAVARKAATGLREAHPVFAATRPYTGADGKSEGFGGKIEHDGITFQVNVVAVNTKGAK